MKASLIVALAALALAATAAPASATSVDGSKQALRCPGAQGTPVRDRAIRGLPVKDARQFAEHRGCEMRVVRRDGEDLIVTDDLSYDRVNVAVRHGRVTRALGIY